MAEREGSIQGSLDAATCSVRAAVPNERDIPFTSLTDGVEGFVSIAIDLMRRSLEVKYNL